MALGLFTLSGTYLAYGDTPASGTVQIDGIPNVIVDNVGDKIKVGPKKVTLDTSGSFTIQLPTNSTSGNSTTLGFRVTARLKHQNIDPVEFYAPAANATLNMADVTPSVVLPVAPFIGPAGPAGPTGATGATGPVGPQGATGATGPQGLPGVNAVANDTATAAYIGDAASATSAALAASIPATVKVTHPAGLARHRAALGRALFTRERVVINGDSITVGAYANDTANSATSDKIQWAQRGWVGQLRKLLAATYGDAGEGYIGFTTDEGRWTYTGTTSGSAAGPVVSGRQINPGGSAAATGLGPFTEVEVLGYHTSVSPPLNLFVDGTDATPTLMTTAQNTLTPGASGWANRGNTTLAHGTDTGEDTLINTAAGAGNMSVQTPITVGNGLPCAAGDKFIVAADINSATASRAWRAGMFFFDATGTQLAELSTTDVTASTVGSYQTKSGLITAPTNTAYAAMIVRIDAAGGAGEVHTLRRVRAIPVTAVAGQGGATLWRATRAGLTDATHDVTIRGAATGNVLTGGVIIKRGTAGVLVSRVGKSGTTSANHAGTDQTVATAANMLTVNFDLMRPDLCIIALGANDIPNQVANGITPAVFKANLKTLTDKVAAVGGCSLLVAGPRYATEVSGGATQATYYQQMIDLANSETHVAFVDVGADQWVSNANANALGFMNNALVGIHPLMAGHGDYARTVLQAVTTRALGSLA